MGAAGDDAGDQLAGLLDKVLDCWLLTPAELLCGRRESVKRSTKLAAAIFLITNVPAAHPVCPSGIDTQSLHPDISDPVRCMSSSLLTRTSIYFAFGYCSSEHAYCQPSSGCFQSVWRPIFTWIRLLLEMIVFN